MVTNYHRQCWPNALSSRANDVLGNLVDEYHVRGEALADDLIDRSQILRDHGANSVQIDRVQRDIHEFEVIGTEDVQFLGLNRCFNYEFRPLAFDL